MKSQSTSLSAVRQARPAIALRLAQGIALTAAQASQIQGGNGEFPWQLSLLP